MTKRTLIPVLLLSSSVAAAAPSTDAETSPELLELRDELVSAGEAALHDVPYFRPLCDAEGYPLVGNVLPKQNPDGTLAPVFQPSEFCTEVRAERSQV